LKKENIFKFKKTAGWFVNQLIIASLITIGLSVMGCNSSSRHESYTNISEESIKKGKELTEVNCQSCHQLPDPSLLNAKTWEEGALPAMGPLMGIFNHKGQSYTYRGDAQMKGPGALASNPMVTHEEWQNIIDYYTATAPEELPRQDRAEEIDPELPLFEILEPKLNYRNSHTTFLKIREDRRAPLVISDATTLKTYFLNNQLAPIDSLTTIGPLTNIDFMGQSEALACNVGILMPNNQAHGTALRMMRKPDRWEIDSISVFSGLHRPLQISQTELNDDGKPDYLVCEFGYMRGGLSWMENQGRGRYEKRVLSTLPGARIAYPLDYNEDGQMDILAMFAQGVEGIFLYLNNGNGSFTEKRLLEFPSVYGSSYFELADFNKDGLLDIIYTSGDNADYTTILKPYHGVYIYLNKGKDKFEQSFFYPIHGCYKAMARDFDKDGDLDLATIAHYADFASQPEEGFVYLENKGDLQFDPMSSPKLEVGRWITMDAGDMDGDGWTDIVLGNFVQPSEFSNPEIDWAEAPPVLVLKNKGNP